MTVDKTASMIVAIGTNDQEHRLRAKEHIGKVAKGRLEYEKLTEGTKMKYGNLSQGSKLKHADIHAAREHKIWGVHVNEIVDKHRKVFGDKNERIPFPLPTGTKLEASKLLRKHYEGEVKEAVMKIKKTGLQKGSIAKSTALREGCISGGGNIKEDDISKGNGISKKDIAKNGGISKTDIGKNGGLDGCKVAKCFGGIEASDISSGKGMNVKYIAKK
jgi:hypothetical protein